MQKIKGWMYAATVFFMMLTGVSMMPASETSNEIQERNAENVAHSIIEEL